MLKVSIFLALVLATSLATFSLNLDRTQISDNQYYKKTAQNNQVTYEQDQQEVGDVVYTYNAKIGDNHEAVVFDTTVGNNWQYVEAAQPAINGSNKVAAGEGRALLTKAQASTEDSVELGDEQLSNVAFQQSNTPDASANLSLLKAANYGLALNRQKQQNFFQTLSDNKVELEQGGNGFSFYLSEKVNQVFFGVPQKFFAEDSLEKIDAKSSLDTNSWVIAFGDKGLHVNGQDDLPAAKQPTYAEFDTTTQYIWASDDVVNYVVSSLSSAGINCNDINTQNHLGVYDCQAGEGVSYPTINLTFSTYNENGENTRVYKLNDYTDSLENGKDRLLIRTTANYASNTLTDVPTLKLGTQDNDLIILGTTFLENVYVFFNQEDHTVNFSQAYNVTPEEQNIDSTWRLWSLILGSLVLLGAIGAILALLTKVPYNPEVQPTLPPVQNTQFVVQQQVPVQQQVVKQQQPVYVTQSIVRPVQQQSLQQQPVYYVANNSPQRFVQSIPPNYQYRQQ